MNRISLEIGTGGDKGMVIGTLHPGQKLDEIVCKVLKNDTPPFLLPFTTAEINGQMRLRYDTGNLISLDYFAAKLTRTEFLRLWNHLLEPLTSCKDWFLRAALFSFDPRFVYIDRHSLTVRYLCIPTEADSSGLPEIKTLLTGVMNQCELLDSPTLQIAFYKYFAQTEFSVSELKRLLAQYGNTAADPPRYHTPIPPIRDSESPPAPVSPPPFSPAAGTPAPTSPPLPRQSLSKEEQLEQELFLSMSGGDGKGSSKKPLFGFGKPKEPKPAKAPKLKKEKPVKGKKNQQVAAALGELAAGAQQKEVLRGAAAQYELPQNRQAYAPPPPPPVSSYLEADDRTEMLFGQDHSGCPTLRLLNPAAHPGLPLEIPLQFQNGSFTIGRFDAGKGVRQSSFEFAADVKSVSRQHACLRQSVDGTCCVIDLGSGNGTFINGGRIASNLPVPIKSGDCVGFSEKGIEYQLL